MVSAMQPHQLSLLLLLPLPSLCQYSMAHANPFSQLPLLLLLPLPSLCQYSVVRHDPFSLLLPSLQPYTATACDGSLLSLHCPGQTRVSISSVSYSGQGNSTPCSLPHSSLLRVQSSCQARESCSLPVSSQSLAPGSTDPCPGTPKCARVVHHCRPNTFRSNVHCVGAKTSHLELSCSSQDQRILVFSSSFLGAGEGGVHCPREGGKMEGLPEGWRDAVTRERMRRCEGQAVTERVMEACHGQVRGENGKQY